MAFYECISKPNNKFAQKFNREDRSLKPDVDRNLFSDFYVPISDIFYHETYQTFEHQIIFY